LPGQLTQRLHKKGVLPTEEGTAKPWAEIRRSRKPVPEVPGVRTPAILHHSLAKNSLLRDGPLKVPLFNLDEHVSSRNFDPVSAAGRQVFFEWLRKSYAELKFKTLAAISHYPIWPGSDDSYHPLEYYCNPASAWLRDCLAEVRVR